MAIMLPEVSSREDFQQKHSHRQDCYSQGHRQAAIVACIQVVLAQADNRIQHLRGWRMELCIQKEHWKTPLETAEAVSFNGSFPTLESETKDTVR